MLFRSQVVKPAGAFAGHPETNHRGTALRGEPGGLVQVFGWTGLPALTGKDAHLHAVIEVWHEWISWALVALVAVHIGAALKHHFVNRDMVLRAMLPFEARSIFRSTGGTD